MLWQASEARVQESQMRRFIDYIKHRYQLATNDYAGLHRFSVEKPGDFWTEIINYFDVVYQGDTSTAVTDLSFEQYGWFPNIKLNFAENLLAHGKPDQIAIKSLLENGSKQELSFAELHAQVAALQTQLGDCFGEGDLLACYMPNISETVIAMLAATASGGVFTSTSADFGVDGVVDRFGQSRPKVLVACAGYDYNGRYFDCLAKVKAIISQVDSIERVIIVDPYKRTPDISAIAHAEFWQTTIEASGTNSTNNAVKTSNATAKIHFVPRAFDAPLYIMYSSGTTGQPKCIVHANGGVLLQHIKELGLHTDHNKNKNIFFFTTCGWMMWNWVVSSLYFGGTTTLYEGSPAYPNFDSFIKIIEKENINIFGTSPKYLKALEDSGTDLSKVNMDSLETVLCTGAPLLPEQYDFIYNKFKRDILLASISGGTDILGCFFLGNPMLPVYRGELQCAGLGMDVACLDGKGEAVIEQTGELVCRKSFPSRPLYFLKDKNNKKLNEAYFNTYPGIWYHGDFIKITRRGGALFFGRSDATLNPGGVRIGTSEIYRQTETLDYIEDTVCVGKKTAGDINIVLFVKMKDEEVLTKARIQEIKQRIKVNTTPRHIPKRVIAVSDIPYTRSGKKIELAVTRIINGQNITNKEAIANPQCLEEYGNIFQPEVA